MTSYRPKIKQNENGTVSDLALDAETVQGIDVVDRLKSVPLYVASVSGTAANTTSGSYYHAKWNLTDARVSTLYDGLRVSFKIPVAGNGSYGTGISINSGDYHPVVFNVNSMVGTRYGVNSTMTLVYNSTQTGTLYINNTSTTITGVWQIEDYDSNTTTTYGTLNYYMRPYVGANRLTAYKIVALDKDNRVIPITTEQYMGTYSTSTTYSINDIVVSSSKYYKSLANSNKNKAVSNTSYWTQITMPSQFTPNTTAFKPDKIYFYNTTAGIAAGAVIGGQTLTEIGYNTSVCAYTFWASITSYKMIYLQGTYNTTTGLFTLDTGANYYKLVPNNTANLTLSSYFTSGKDYIFVGATYSSANYFQLAMVNIMYHFDGTNLVQYDTYRANTIVASIPSPVTESTVSGWGFTKNAGTVTSVSAGTGLSISGTASTTPTVNVASGYKLLTTTEYNTLNAKVSNVQSDWNATTGLAQILNKPTIPTKASWNYDDRYVRFDTWQQNLTEEQKINARINIDAASSDFSYNDLQDLPIGSIKEIPYTVTSYTEEAEERTVLVYDLIEDYEGTIWYFPAFTRRKPAGTYISGTYKLYAGKIGGQYSGEMCTLYGGEFMILDRKNYGVAIYNSKGLIYAGEIGNITSLVDRMYIPAINESDRESNLNVGSVTKPVYLMRASYTDDHDYYYKPCSLYAGGTAVTLNGTSKAASTASFYAPTSYGSSGQFLKSAGANASPTWVNLATVATSGSYNDLSNKPTIPTKSSWNYDDVYVKYTAAQTLTEDQKAQARANIGASRNPHEHPTYLETTADTPSVTMVPDASYKLTTGGGSNVIFKTPSDAYKLMESLRKGSEETTAVGYYKIATINHNNWNFCNFTMLITNTYSGTVYNTIFECRCSDNNNTLVNFGLNIIAGTDISSKLTYLYTKDANNYITKIEVFIHATRFEHPICYILNTRPGQQLVIPTQQEFNKVTPDQPDGTTMTGTAKYIYDSMYLKKGGDTIGTGGLTLGSGNGNGILFPSSAASSGDSSIGIYDSSNNNQYCTLNGFISGTFTVGHGNFPLNLRGSATRPQYKGADLALKSDVPTRVTGSMSYPTNTGDLATLFNLINNHRNIRLWTYKYTSGSKEIRNLLYFTTHNELSGSLYTVKLSYINSTGTLTEMTSGTIYYEYFT